MNTALFPHNGLDNSEYNVIQAQVCTALAHNSDHVGLVPNDVQKGFKTEKVPTFLSVCYWMCHATTRGGRNLVPAIFYSLSWHPNLLLQHHTIWKCLRLRGVAKSFCENAYETSGTSR